MRFFYTLWDDLPGEFKGFFAFLREEDASAGEEFYMLYYQWFVVMQTLASVFQTGNITAWQREQQTARFAVAYWLACGEDVRLRELYAQIQAAHTLLYDPSPTEVAQADFLETYYHDLRRIPSAYLFFRFIAFENAMQESPGLKESLQEMTGGGLAMPAAVLTPRPYERLDEENLPQIIHDAREVLAMYGLQLPELELTTGFDPVIQEIRP